MSSVESRIAYFFAEIGVFDYFGPTACQRIVDSGVESIREVFGLTESDFETMGFPSEQASRLAKELRESRHAMVDQHWVLRAIGVNHASSGLSDPGLPAELPDEAVKDAQFLMQYFKGRTIARPDCDRAGTLS